MDKASLERLNEYDDFMIFKAKVKNAKENINLVNYYQRIIYALLSDDRKSILEENKDMILSNINNLLKMIYKVKNFVEDEL